MSRPPADCNPPLVCPDLAIRLRPGNAQTQLRPLLRLGFALPFGEGIDLQRRIDTLRAVQQILSSQQLDFPRNPARSSLQREASVSLQVGAPVASPAVSEREARAVLVQLAYFADARTQ